MIAKIIKQYGNLPSVVISPLIAVTHEILARLDNVSYKISAGGNAAMDAKLQGYNPVESLAQKHS